MDKCVITIPSPTMATKASRLLGKSGIRARSVRLSPEKNKRGCASGVAVDEKDCDTAMLILKRNGIAYSGTVTLR